MSSKSQFPSGARKPIQRKSFTQILDEKAKKVQERREAEGATEVEDAPEPVGQLPLPTEQIVTSSYYEWKWEPILDEVIVSTTMQIDDERWTVQLSLNEKITSWAPEDAKRIGEALLSAWQYQYVWKNNFADMSLNAARNPKPQNISAPWR